MLHQIVLYVEETPNDLSLDGLLKSLVVKPSASYIGVCSSLLGGLGCISFVIDVICCKLALCVTLTLQIRIPLSTCAWKLGFPYIPRPPTLKY